MAIKKYKNKRDRIRVRIRSKIRGTPEQPRLSVFRSNKYIFAQIINDVRGITIVAASDLKLSGSSKKSERAHVVGKLIAQASLAKDIKQVVFDRGGYRYHGRVKALADGAREGGLEF